jgi:CRISPR/Cas system-associated exonuclease Cas4 (RecB family)
MRKIKGKESKGSYNILVNVILAQAFIVLFLTVYHLHNYRAFGDYQVSKLITAVFVFTTVFSLGKINYLAQKAAAARALEVKLEQNRQLVQIFDTQNRDFLQCVENIEILNSYGKRDMIGSYITQVRREYESLLELVKLEVPQYTAAAIKKLHEVEADFFNLYFTVDTDLKDLEISQDDIEKVFECIRDIRQKYKGEIPLEKRSMELHISLQGQCYLFRLTSGWSYHLQYPELAKGLRTIRSIIQKYRGTMEITMETDRTVLTLLMPKNLPDWRDKERYRQDDPAPPSPG